jgi:hypothetical protein
MANGFPGVNAGESINTNREQALIDGKSPFGSGCAI